MSSYARHYNMKAGGFDFSNNLAMHALCTMAVNTAQSGMLNMQAEGYHFTGNYDFKAHGMGQCNYPGLPRAMVKMAVESVKTGRPVYEAEGRNYVLQNDFRAMVDIMAQAIRDFAPEVAQRNEPEGKSR